MKHIQVVIYLDTAAGETPNRKARSNTFNLSYSFIKVIKSWSIGGSFIGRCRFLAPSFVPQ